jgi:hypothetical protein
MPSDFAPLLGILAEAFGEPVAWAGTSWLGRFRIDPFVVSLPMTDAGIGETQTWLYCDRAAIHAPDMPDIGDVLTIRSRLWEIVEFGEDDLGELAFRLIKFEGEAPPAPGPTDQTDVRRPGRPSRREEIIETYRAIAAQLPRDAPASQVFATIRLALTGKNDPEAVGLSDKTLRKILAPLRQCPKL